MDVSDKYDDTDIKESIVAPVPPTIKGKKRVVKKTMALQKLTDHKEPGKHTFIAPKTTNHTLETVSSKEDKSAPKDDNDEVIIRVSVVSNDDAGDEFDVEDYLRRKCAAMDEYDIAVKKLSEFSSTTDPRASTSRLMIMQAINNQGSKQAKIEAYRKNISTPVEPNEASGLKTVRIKPVENKDEDEDEDPDPNPGDLPNEPLKDKQLKKKLSLCKKKKNYSSGSSSDGDDNLDEYNRSIKMTPPVPYDGRNDLEYFDNWALSVTNYVDIMKIHERTMMKMMSGYVSGQAQTFYNLNIFR
ncbi:hypothetical protein BDM02DRAFT_3193888 [Thelephora ganbajun]|uniref:Uncharacterized protein n=1 Tax=Thelephora ganbajun TaxID=370292 RepID=A0ACB6YXI1_THEGA|nr:hypothetical protein BDM02DRAFT_3193888 [Thelephora ganbajun]